MIFGLRLETNAVISRIDHAIRDAHVMTILDVNTIIVPVCIAVNLNTVHNNICTLVISLHPASCIQKCHISDFDIFTPYKLDELRTYKMRWSYFNEIIIRTIELTGIKKTVNIES